MRPWRKLHSNIVNSDKLAEVSDGAAVLFFLLVVSQDDAGVYPNSRVKLQALTVTRAWSVEQIRGFLVDLEGAGMVEVDEKSITIVGGVEKNGLLDKRFTPKFYFESNSAHELPSGPHGERIPASWKPLQLPMLEETREEKDSEGERDLDEGSDTEKTLGQHENKSLVLVEVLSLYESNIGKTGPIMKSEIHHWINEVGVVWMVDAIKAAVEHGVLHWSYIKGTLENWKREGRGGGRRDFEDTSEYFKGRYGHLVKKRFSEEEARAKGG